MRIPFCTQSYRSDVLPLSAQRCVNLIPEVAPPDAKSQLILKAAPGLTRFATCGDGPMRGREKMGESLFVVSGGAVFQVGANGSAARLSGADIAGTAPVTMASNGVQIAICAPPYGYVINGATVTQITAAAFPAVSSVASLDGYEIWTTQESGEFILSALLDASSYDALDFATAENSPDNLVRCFTDHHEVWLFGVDTTEIWIDSGDSSFPFRSSDGGLLEKGLGAANAVARFDNSVTFLGTDKIVWRGTGGGQAERISHHAIEAAIESCSDIADAEAWSYSQDGHTFFCLNIPELQATFLYDAATKGWSERKSGLVDTGLWRANFGVAAFNKVLVGDRASGGLFALDKGAYTEDGSPIQRLALSAPIHANGKRFTMGAFEPELDVGHGLATGQGSDPQIGCSFSDDGGYTFGNERLRSVGRIGEYRKRVLWQRNGQARQRVVRVAYSEPTPFAIIAADADIQALAP